MRPAKIHITGASGSGTTTLGRALARSSGWTPIDADDFYWAPVEPKFSSKHSPEQRNSLLSAELDRHPAWVLSGAVKGWELRQEQEFDLIVYLSLPTPLRLQRLRDREVAEFGEARIGVGGHMHMIHEEFMAWAGRYDTAGLEQRSRVSLAAWLALVDRPVLRIEGDVSVEERLRLILQRLQSRDRPHSQ